MAVAVMSQQTMHVVLSPCGPLSPSWGGAAVYISGWCTHNNNLLPPVLRTVNPAVSPADADLLASKLADPATGTIDYKRFVAATAQAQSTMLDPTPAGASSTNSEESVAGTLESGSTSARGPGRSLRRAVEQQSKIFSPEVEPVSPSCRKAREDNINVTTPKARDPLTWDPARKLNAEETELHKLQEEMKDKLFGRTSTMLESFRSFDVSGEGTISYPEFHRGLERIGVSIRCVCVRVHACFAPPVLYPCVRV